MSDKRDWRFRASRVAALLLAMTGPWGAAAAHGMGVTDKGVCQVPIILAKDAPADTVRAARELAMYIEKISGARPAVLLGTPSPVPTNVLWVGIQPAMTNLFPRVDLEFQHYRRAFGPAAKEVESYFDLMEQVHERIINEPGFRHSSGAAREAAEIYRRVYADPVLDKVGDWLKRATAKAAEGPEVYQKRVAFVVSGHQFVKLQVAIMRVMAKVRESKGTNSEAVKTAITLCDARDAHIRGKGGVRFPDRFRERMLDYLGPPSEAFRKAAGLKESGSRSGLSPATDERARLLPAADAD